MTLGFYLDLRSSAGNIFIAGTLFTDNEYPYDYYYNFKFISKTTHFMCVTKSCLFLTTSSLLYGVLLFAN